MTEPITETTYTARQLREEARRALGTEEKLVGYSVHIARHGLRDVVSLIVEAKKVSKDGTVSTRKHRVAL